MYDITKKEEKKKTILWKDWATNLLLAYIPAGILIVLLKEIGITGVIPTMILVFGGAAVVGKIRSKRGYVATWKSVLWALGAIVLVFILIPIIFIALSE